MPKIYRANNTIEDIHPENGVDFTLKEVQTLVGGYIERIQNSNSPLIVLANEEARLQGLPFNNQISIKLGIELYGDILIIEHEYFR